MEKFIILIALVLASCGISEQDVQATISAIPTQTLSPTNTPSTYIVGFEVRSTLANAFLYDNLWEISWGRNGSGSSATYTALDVYSHDFQGPGYRIHWTETIKARTGDTVYLSIEGYPNTPAADCAIIIADQDVSTATKGEGGGTAKCEYLLP